MIVLVTTTSKASSYLTRFLDSISSNGHSVIPLSFGILSLVWYRTKGAKRLVLSTSKAKMFLTLPARLLGMRVLWIEDALVDRALSKKIRRVFTRLLSHGVQCVTPARLIKEQLVRAGIAADRIHVVPSGIDAERLGVQETLFTPIAERKSKRRAGFSIGTIAGLEDEKGLEYLLQAFTMATKQVPHLHLTIMGHGPKKQSLHWLAKKLGVAPAVLFVGWQENHERWLQNFDLLVMPHLRKEGWSEVLITAMAFGKPIIATNVGAFPEIIEKRKTGILIEPANATMLAEAILNLYHHPEWREEMGKLSRERVREHFSHDRMTRGVLSLLH